MTTESSQPAHPVASPKRAIRAIRSFCFSAILWISAAIFITSLLLWIASYFWVIQVNWSIRPFGIWRVATGTGTFHISLDTMVRHDSDGRVTRINPDTSDWTASVVPPTDPRIRKSWRLENLFPTGFFFDSYTTRVGPPNTTTVSRLRFPYWAPALLALPGFLLVWRRLRRFGPGKCHSCGYDLRATPDRCPECGAGRTPAVEPGSDPREV